MCQAATWRTPTSFLVEQGWGAGYSCGSPMRVDQGDARQAHYDAKSSAYTSGSTRSLRIVDLVGGPNLRVLDVACGPGHIGAQIRQRGNTVVGIEVSSSAAAEAATKLDEVHSFDIEAPWPDHVVQRTFDVVVMGEVLEHVFDPVIVLKRAHGVLSSAGRIVITTPNFLVWIARLQVLFGRFRYQQYGLFDFGHIRWFTYAYLRQVLDEAGFEIATEHHIAHPKRLARLGRRWPSLFALNFVVAANKRGA
jgi:SAM-dependent methyltransferase